MKKITIIASVCLIIPVSMYLSISFFPSVPAQFTDSIVRPLLGSSKTITLESWYFNFNDKINKLESGYKKPSANIFDSPLSAYQPLPLIKNNTNSNVMVLNNLHPTQAFAPLANEGKWQIVPQKLFPNNVVTARTFIRPDKDRDYAIVSLVAMNMQELSIGVQAGTYYPGGIYGKYGEGKVPPYIQESNSLVAAFNGGFMATDGNYGMVLSGKTFVPLRQGLATLTIYDNGSASILQYDGQSFGKNVVALRQNGAFLIKDGKITQFVENSLDTWGRTTTNSTYTWRSGIGITKSGNLIYAVGNSLIPETLAISLQQAGAVQAMQLDINPNWVRYVFYESQGEGKYNYYPLLSDMQNGGYSYLHGYNKDFFYVYKKAGSSLLPLTKELSSR